MDNVVTLPTKPDLLAREPGFAIDFAAMIAKAARPLPTLVYPGYIAWRIKQALKVKDPDGIITEVGAVETVGDCVHEISLTDFNGTRYRVTVEVEPRK